MLSFFLRLVELNTYEIMYLFDVNSSCFEAEFVTYPISSDLHLISTLVN